MLFCNSFRREFSPCQSWFAVQEGEDDKPLNVADTFGGVDDLKMGLLKLVLTLFVLGTQVYTYVGSDNLYFYYFAYFSSWGMLWSILYMLLSLCNSAFDLPQPQPSFKTTDVENDNDKENLQIISIRAKITWIFATLALLTGSTETIIYWTLVYEMGNDVSYLDLAPHGLVFLVVTIDAFHLNRIPLRWMHLWMVWGFTLSFICWSFLQGPLAFDIDNPDQEDDDPDTNDDAIYANLSWQSDDITKTVIFSLSVTFILQPILFSFCVYGQEALGYGLVAVAAANKIDCFTWLMSAMGILLVDQGTTPKYLAIHAVSKWCMPILVFLLAQHQLCAVGSGKRGEIGNKSVDSLSYLFSTCDDAIYANLSWQSDDITKTVIFSLSVTFILQPILFSILRAWSRGSWLWSSCCCSGQQDRLFYVADGSNGDAFSTSGDDSEVFSNERVVVNVEQKGPGSVDLQEDVQRVEMVHANSGFPSCSSPIVCC
eukprot:CAMPEP_0198154916 /NCGR_PEP_ID=MMETSP1443-20131203/68856_1 /TAXON_ID=186043 /ORGANISM="Entomoneis sp., Strain CCMP2396" /LENGTH=483 /DNA_ID=CAMNT_0043821633 /DNA_START=354 /DNA_END=1806 /DNA_ORIENTATION=-